jgi:hypothetical protein
MPKTYLDGAVSYEGRDELADIKLNGVSVLNLVPQLVKVWPNGRGFVLVTKNWGMAAKPVKRLIDGQYKNFTLYGAIEITL